MKKALSIFLYIIGLILLFFIIVFSTILILRRREDPVVTNFRKNLYIDEENDMPLPAVAIAAIVVSATGVVTVGAVTVGCLIKFDAEKVHKIDDVYRQNGLKVMSNQCHGEIEKLAKAFDFLQKNREKMFKDTMDLRNMERMYMLKASKVLEEKQKKELDGLDKFINAIDFLNVIKSKEVKLKEQANDKKQSQTIIDRNLEEVKHLESQIAAMRKINRQNQKEIQKALDNLEKLHESVQDHIKCFEEKRSEFIMHKLKNTDEPHFTYESENYREVQFAVIKMLGESRDEHGKPSAEIVCGFTKVFEQMVYQGREYSLVSQGNSIQKTLYDEAGALDKLKGEVKFPSFYQIMNRNEMPENYDPSKPTLLYSKEEVKLAIEYLNDKKRVFGDMRKTQAALEGKMDIVNECNFNLEQNIKRIEWNDKRDSEEKKNGKVDSNKYKKFTESSEGYLNEINKKFRYGSHEGSSIPESVDLDSV